MRQVRGSFGGTGAHWAGDGFPLRSMPSHAAPFRSSRFGMIPTSQIPA